MSILIKGMEMPTNCDVCFMRDACEYSMPLGKRLTECPLIEIPPHGRLIDANAFSEKILEIVARQKYDEFYTESLSVGAILREVVNELRGVGLDGFNNAPTIIEAEETNK